MVNQGQKEPKASTQLSPVSHDDDIDFYESEAADTSLSPGQGLLSSGESSEEEAEVHLPDTNPFGAFGTTNIPSLGPRPVIPGIGTYVVNPPTMSKQETGLPSNITKHYGDFKPGQATMVSTSKPLPGIGNEAVNHPIISKQQTVLPSGTLRYDGDFKISTATAVSNSKTLPQPFAATQLVPSIFPGQKLLPSFLDLPKSVQHTGSHKISSPEKDVTSRNLPSINPQSTVTSLDFENFKFTLNAPVPHEPGHSPAKERFSFSQEFKARSEEVNLAPVRRPVVKPNRFTQIKDLAQPHDVPSIVSALTPENEASVAKASTPAPQTKKPDEVPVFVPIKTSLPEPFTPTNQAKKPIEKPKLIPIKPSLAKPPVPTHQARQSTEFLEFPVIKSPVETGYKRPTTKDVRCQEGPSVQMPQASTPAEAPHFPAGEPPVEKQYKRPTTKDVERQEGKADADKKADPAAMRELLAEKRDLRSQRDTLARENNSLESNLHRLTDEVKKFEGREEETKRAMSAKSKEIADLETENDRLKKEMEELSLLPAPKPDQKKVSLPAGTGISENSTVDGDLLAEKAAEINALNDENKQRTKKETDLKASTEAEVWELKAKLRKAEDDLNQKKREDEYNSKRIDREVKKIKDLSDELTKTQISNHRLETEFRAQTVKLNKGKTREAEANSNESEMKKLRQSVKESEADAKLAKDRAEKLKKDLEASKGEIKAVKAQNDKLAKDLEQSSGREVTAPASSDPNLRKIETAEASQTPPNRAEETNEGGKQKMDDLTAANELLRKDLKVSKVMGSLKDMCIALNVTTPTPPEETSNEEDKQKIRDLIADVEALQKELDFSAQVEKIGSEGDKQKIRDLTAEVEALRKDLESAKVLQPPKFIEIHGLKAATDSDKGEETSIEGKKQKIRDLTSDNETLRKELEESKLMRHVRSIEADGLETATSPTRQHKETSSSEEDKQKTRKLIADNEALLEEIDKLRKASNETMNPLIARNKALAEDCQHLKKEIVAQNDKVGKLSASNEELGRKLKISEERALRKAEGTDGFYADFDSMKTTNAEQKKKLDGLRAKLAEEARARQKSDSLANQLERKLAAQSGSLREVAEERAELMGKVSDQEAKLTEYQDARKSVTVEAELEVTKTMMERQRVRFEDADAKRAQELKTTLDTLEQNERKRRQLLIEEVEAKSKLLLEAKKEISELNRKLAVSNETIEAALANAAAAAAAATAASASENPSQSFPSSPSSQISPGDGHPSPPNTTTTTTTTSPTTAGTMPWFRLQRFPTTCIQMNLSPRRLLTFLFLFGLAFLGPYNHSRDLGRQSTEERDMWRAANENSRREIIDWSSRDQGIVREEARVVAAWDR